MHVSCLPFVLSRWAGLCRRRRPCSVTVTDLRCEYLTDPLGIDVPQPRLSWKLAAVDPQCSWPEADGVPGPGGEHEGPPGQGPRPTSGIPAWLVGPVGARRLHRQAAGLGNGVLLESPRQGRGRRDLGLEPAGTLDDGTAGEVRLVGQVDRHRSGLQAGKGLAAAGQQGARSVAAQDVRSEGQARAGHGLRGLGRLSRAVRQWQEDRRRGPVAGGDEPPQTRPLCRPTRSPISSKQGKNVIALWLGVSWSIFPPYKTDDKPQTPIVLAQADIRLPGGEAVRIVTDDSWRTHPSPNTLLGVWDFMHFGGERYDADKEVPGWCEAEFRRFRRGSRRPSTRRIWFSRPRWSSRTGRSRRFDPVAVEEVQAGRLSRRPGRQRHRLARSGRSRQAGRPDRVQVLRAARAPT